MNNLLLSLSSQEIEILKQVEQQLREHQSEFTEQLNNILKSLIFYNSHTLHPVRLREIGGEEIENFLQFLLVCEDSTIIDRGKKLAAEGLGYKSLLSIVAYLMNRCLEKITVKEPELLKIFIKAATLYIYSVFEGYLEEYKEKLMREQVQFTQAFQKVQERQQN